MHTAAGWYPEIFQRADTPVVDQQYLFSGQADTANPESDPVSEILNYFRFGHKNSN
jgi:hypothetical protein